MIYFARDPRTGHVKIGYSKRPAERLCQLRTACPGIEIIATTQGAKPEETALHDKYRAKRVAGEWFSLTPEEVAAEAALAPPDPGREPLPPLSDPHLFALDFVEKYFSRAQYLDKARPVVIATDAIKIYLAQVAGHPQAHEEYRRAHEEWRRRRGLRHRFFSEQEPAA